MHDQALANDSGPTTPDSYQHIDAFLESQMGCLGIPGACLAIVEGTRMAHFRGLGHARPHGEAPTGRTPFVLGSLTKSFTALAVMQLVEAGRIDLDAPVRTYLAWFRVADPDSSSKMTVRHLLNQTSGLPTLAGMRGLADMDPRPDAAQRQARELASLELSHEPGERFAYCNLNYILLGLVVESVTQETYADYVQRHIFDPLRMSHSFASEAIARRHGLAVGHRLWFGRPVAAPNLPIPTASLAAGQLISCADDMANYLVAHLNQGRFLDEQILSEAGMDELHRVAGNYRAMGMSVGSYAMGWFVSDIGSSTGVWHGGNVADFSSFMALLPGHGKGFIFLANADPYGLPPVTMELGLGLAALLAGGRPPAPRLAVIPRAMRWLWLLPLLQVVHLVATLRTARGWRHHPETLPGPGRPRLLPGLLPVVPDLFVASVPLLVRSQRLRGYLSLYLPDVYWTMVFCGWLGTGSAVLRTGLVLGTPSKAPKP